MFVIRCCICSECPGPAAEDAFVACSDAAVLVCGLRFVLVRGCRAFPRCVMYYHHVDSVRWVERDFRSGKLVVGGDCQDALLRAY